MRETREHVLPLDGTVVYPRDVVGGKGGSIAKMAALGLSVPPAFVIPIAVGQRYRLAGLELESGIWEEVIAGVGELEGKAGRSFGDLEAPMLVSVRSGAAMSMPGMMDTILNLGINDDVERALARMCGDRAFARATHTRFVYDFGTIVLRAPVDSPEAASAPEDARAAVAESCGLQVPTNPLEQLRAAICAVFESWSSRRAVAYRRQWGLSDEGGTAVVVQAMAFGNLGKRSGTGVLFTRDPLNGAPAAYGEWLLGAQGDDVVGGTHSPASLSTLQREMPEVHRELVEAGQLLEREHRDVQDIEFTVEQGRLYLLQTRAAKRSAVAAVRIAADLASEGIIDRRSALSRVSSEQLAAAIAPRIAPPALDTAEILAEGVPACPGVAWGTVVLDGEDAQAADGDVVLARPMTSPADIEGIIAARGLVTERGGATSHAAVVSRALGRPSVVGVGEGTTGGWAGQEITVDGGAGVVYAGRLALEETDAGSVPGFDALLAWAREQCPVRIVESAEEVVDLDARTGEVDPSIEALAEVIRGAPAVAGCVVASAAGARAVVASGVTTVVRRPEQDEALLLLHLAHAAREEDGRGSAEARTEEDT
ncbi:MAG TPA: pyruvate, phosphate dikinase [Solirubrobacteraceae bacterium]|jgi:pyruvate,orthophosphate dikinase|nr:pyruvate, phosphate dikinase [Solirubrobacteraceae bacterium]